jgi:beta-lactamase superfamily II metal-dependent hydrolase
MNMAPPVYAGYPTAKVYTNPVAKESERIGHLLWGTWMEDQNQEQGDWMKVRIRGWDVNRQPLIGWVKKDKVQREKLLEVYFIDVGQGDGCLMITPDDEFHLIDAGVGPNMGAYLNWKFRLSNQVPGTVDFKSVIISHPDQDHYRGFSDVLDQPRARFENVYHNGLVERVGDDSLGPRVGDFLTSIVTNHAELDAIIGDDAQVGTKRYPNLLRKFRANGANIRMLCSEDKFLPGYGENDPVKIHVLGPVPETDAAGNRVMRWFGPKSSPGPTKNGHSIVLGVEYGSIKLLLGGDLNIPAEHHLLKHYTGIDPKTVHSGQISDIITKARKFFQVDVAKACHHGSADFSNIFIQSVNAAATVISSGDQEPHSHPRPDAVGALGKFGRSDRPLIFSTELARSTRDFIVKENPSTQELGRTVAVYGNIDLRTDGERIVIAQRFESTPAHGEWDFYELVKDANGVISYNSKHD